MEYEPHPIYRTPAQEPRGYSQLVRVDRVKTENLVQLHDRRGFLFSTVSDWAKVSEAGELCSKHIHEGMVNHERHHTYNSHQCEREDKQYVRWCVRVWRW